MEVKQNVWRIACCSNLKFMYCFLVCYKDDTSSFPFCHELYESVKMHLLTFYIPEIYSHFLQAALVPTPGLFLLKTLIQTLKRK